MKSKLNFNINKDESIHNDYLFCWSEIGKKPSKVVIYENFDGVKFLDFFLKILQDVSKTTDIIPLDDCNIVNEKVFGKISDGCYISFTNFDKTNQTSFIGELVFYFNPDMESDVENFIKELENFKINDENSEEDETEQNLYSITLNQSGFQLQPIQGIEYEIDNIDLFYNDEEFKRIKKLNKKIKNKNKGLSIICGERGTGKTNLVNFFANSNKQKKFIFIPITILESVINNIEFRNFLSTCKDSVIILDDCEAYLSHNFNKSNILTNHILQLVDGIDSHIFNLHFLVILNCENESDIDSNLFECNNLIDNINLYKLSKSKIQELTKFLGKKNKFKSPTKLVSVLNGNDSSIDNKEMGFN